MIRAVPSGMFAGGEFASDLAEIPLSGGTCSKGTGAAGADGSNPSRSTIIESVIIAECDCCGAERALSRCWLGDMETFACEECQS